MDQENRKDIDSLKRPVFRSRSDCTPVKENSLANVTGEFVQGNIKQSRWRSWSFPQGKYGIPLGTLTAREAAKSFWNSDMLNHRLEKIAECAALETASHVDGDEVDDELDSSSETEQLTACTSSKEGSVSGLPSEFKDGGGPTCATDNDDPPAVGSIPANAPEEVWEKLEQSATRLKTGNDSVCSSRTKDGLLVTRSAPTLRAKRQVKPFPSTLVSHSTRVF